MRAPFFTLLLCLSASGSALDADQIIERSVQGVYSGSEESTYRMTLSGSDGEKETRSMKVYFKREGKESTKLLIKFLEPADIRGTGFLSIIEKGKSPDQWIYLPELKRTRRIQGGNESESFLGSDFTMGDLSVRNDRHLYVYQVTDADKKCSDGTGSCYLITGTLKAGGEAPYSKKILEIRKDNYVAMRVEFFDPEGKLRKILQLKAVRQDASGWFADQVEMKDVALGHKTLIEVEKRETSKKLGDSAFTQSALQR